MLSEEIITKYQGLIFDMDGTIIDTMPSHAKAWEKVGEELGYPISGQIMFDMGGAPVREIAEEMIRRYQIPTEMLEELIRLKRQYGFEMVRENAVLLPTFEIIPQYFGKIPMALGTGSHRVMVDFLLEKFAIRHYFNAIVDADDVSRHKPDPETFLRCAEKLGLKPQDCLVFEDADFGVQAAHSAGMDVFDVRINQIIKAK